MDIPSFESFFDLIKKLSLTIGIIILKPKHRWTKLDWVIYGFGFYNAFVSFYSFICNIVSIVKIFQNGLYFFLIGEVPVFFWTTTLCINMVILIYNYDDISNLANEFKDLYAIDWSVTEDSRTFVRRLRSNKRSIIAYQIFFLSINVIFSVTPLLTTGITYFTTGIYQPVYIAPNTLYPFDKVKFYWAAYIVEVILARVSTLVGIVIDVLVLIFIIQLTFHFECLGAEIQLIQNQAKQNDGVYKKSLKRMFKIHQRLLESNQKVDDFFQFVIFWKYVGCSTSICCSGFLIMTLNNTGLAISLSMLLLANLYQIYILCYFGDQLIEKSSTLADTVYCSNWYTRNMDEIKMIRLLIMRAQRPCFISIFKFSNLSMVTFKTIISSAYQLLTVLRKTNSY